ncbi:MAG: GTP-binding protein [Spirochaetaceae bacterium]|nr:MAG: GTP-binding protein [Spirochaetaceae bacterium]
MDTPIQAIPTNIVMGFLGCGKTTRIQSLLDNKDPSEPWGVLINEFGQVGIDGKTVSGAAVKEVAGGCMCCTASLPTQIALTMLIRKTRPQRIIIEPTGLGHPTQLLAMLQEEHYRNVIELQSIICLIDPRRLDDPRYTQNALFRDQAFVADVLLASKVDLCDARQLENFHTFAHSFQPAKDFIGLSERGSPPDKYLQFPHNPHRSAEKPKHHHAAASQDSIVQEPTLVAESDTPGQTLQPIEWSRTTGGDQDFFSCGWRFGAAFVFEEDELSRFFRSSGAVRAKGYVKSPQGIRLFSLVDQHLDIDEIEETSSVQHTNESLLEFIFARDAVPNLDSQPDATQALDITEQGILACLHQPGG